MWRTIRWAKENNLDYVYLGTCYKKKALYKVRDHKGIEFFDGVRWNDNNELLKYFCKLDEEKELSDHDILKSLNEKERDVFRDLFE